MKIIAISDTHGKHEAVQLPSGDLLIHAGDISRRGDESEVVAFLDWFSAQPFKHKIFIAGNHDFFFEKNSREVIESIIPSGIIYLNDSGVEIEGFRVWGSPISPFFFNWAFNRRRGAPIRAHWDLIPKDTDILITHGPAFGLFDLTESKVRAGCEDLKMVIDLIRPRAHICGHIHEGFGMREVNGTIYINASVLNARYQLVNPPVEFEL